MNAETEKTIVHEVTLQSKHGNKPIQLDLRYRTCEGLCPVVIFVHGFKGFKEWGPFNLIADRFAEAGLAFVKMSLSHSGVTDESPTKIVDHEAFRKNNISIELDDVQTVIDWLYDTEKNEDWKALDLEKVFLMGHSRGGAVSLLKASEDPRIAGVVTWAAISNFEDLWNWVEHWVWKLRGVFYEWDQWHLQHLPVDYQLADDFYQNQARFHVRSAVEKLKKPLLVIHASNDQIVPPTMAREITHWHDNCEAMVLPEGGHLFGMEHPYRGTTLPFPCERAVKRSISFVKRLCENE